MEQIKEECDDEYKFTSDWFSYNIPIWQQYLNTYKDKENIRVLEIGSYQGRSTIWLLENILTHPTSRITCIDTFLGSDEHSKIQKENIWETFNYNINKFKNKVNIVTGYSQTILRGMFEKEIYDMIYIDGDHKGYSVLEDAILSFPLLKKNGLMIFDDYAWDHVPNELDRPKVGIAAFCSVYTEQISILHVQYQLILKKL